MTATAKRASMIPPVGRSCARGLARLSRRLCRLRCSHHPRRHDHRHSGGRHPRHPARRRHSNRRRISHRQQDGRLLSGGRHHQSRGRGCRHLGSLERADRIAHSRWPTDDLRLALASCQPVNPVTTMHTELARGTALNCRAAEQRWTSILRCARSAHPSSLSPFIICPNAVTPHPSLPVPTPIPQKRTCCVRHPSPFIYLSPVPRA